MKKSLSSEIPYMGDMQASKNPFSKGKVTSLLRNSCPDKIESPTPEPEAKCAPFSIIGVKDKSTQVQNPSLHSANLSVYLMKGFKKLEASTPRETSTKIDQSTYERKVSVDNTKSSREERTKLSSEVKRNFKKLIKLTLPTIGEIACRRVMLPPIESLKKKTNKTLVLDIDGTLIYKINSSSFDDSLNEGQSKQIPVTYKDTLTSNSCSVKVVIRPYAIRLLQELSPLYEIIVIITTTLLDLHIST